jgi:hypothetical protein
MHGGASDPRLRWYPKAWRARYGDELIALLDDEYNCNLPVKVRLGLVTSGLEQRTRQSGLIGDSLPAVDRVRAGALVILAAWTAFVIAGASFAKFSEHFDEALPHNAGAHQLPDLAFTVLQSVAGIASVLVLTGALLAAPAFVRFLRTEGWASVRGHYLRALACTALTVVVTVLLFIWARHLTSPQRNGGLHWYGGLFLIWALLIALTLALWTVAAIATAKRIELSRTILNVEATLAVVIAGAMLVMSVAIAVWWGAMAKDASAFLRASPAGTPGSPWDVWLIATIALMVLALTTAAAGVVREVSVSTDMRCIERGTSS